MNNVSTEVPTGFIKQEHRCPGQAHPVMWERENPHLKGLMTGRMEDSGYSR